MVGLWFLVPAIGVRVPDRQQILEIKNADYQSLHCERMIFLILL